MQLFTGNIVTCDSKDSVFKFMVENKGKIEFIGDALPSEYASLPKTEFKHTIVPSFVDSHIHYSSWSFFAHQLNFVQVASFSDIETQLKQYAATSPNKIIVGFGLSANNVLEKRLPNRIDIDGWIQKPTFLVKYDGHAACLNSSMIESLPEKVRNMRGFSDMGVLTNEAFYAAVDAVTSSVSPIKLIKNMMSGISMLGQRGISMVHTVEGIGFPKDLDIDIARLLGKGQKGDFQFRVFFQTLDVQKVIKRKLPRIGGCFATALDGCFGSVDAALILPYSDDANNKGILYYEDQRVEEFCKYAHNAGLQIQLHAIGDAAFDQAVGSIKKAIQQNPRDNHRHTIIHACLTTEDALKDCAKWGIGIATQPAFLHWGEEPYPYLKKILGNRVDLISPHRTMLDLGIHVSGGSDGPCTPPDPIRGIHAACNHFRSDQSISIGEALKMFTYEACYGTFDEQQHGSLEKGKRADFVILDKNPLEINLKELSSINVIDMYLGGKKFKQNQGLASLLYRGITRRSKKI